MSHTPGPWNWWTSCSFNRLSSDATGKDGDVLHAVKYHDGVCGIEGSQADMRLIAAAPDLLEACEAFSHDVDLRDAIQMARKAIKKARGE